MSCSLFLSLSLYLDSQTLEHKGMAFRNVRKGGGKGGGGEGTSWTVQRNVLETSRDERTWCSSAKRENFSHIPQISLYHSLVSLYLRISSVLLTIIIECYEILNSRFALEHRYSLWTVNVYLGMVIVIHPVLLW